MSLGERCDEIVRLIDETLAELASPASSLADTGAVVTPLAPRGPRATWAEVLRRSGAALPDSADRAAAGF